VTTGSIESRVADVGAFRVARIVFPPELTLPLHSHPRATVAVILRGGFDGTTRGGSHPCPTGSMLTEPAGEDHGNRFAPAGATVLVVQPDPARAELLEPFAALLDRFDYQQNGFVGGLARRASNELNAGDAVAPFALEGLILELLATAARVRNPNGSRSGRRPPPWLDEARDLLHARPGENLRVSEVAEVIYKCTAIYRPDDERTLIWNDPDLSIRWPVEAPIVSGKDARGFPLSRAECYA